MKGEVCAWSESSAIAYCNSVLGGRTNIEGFQSGFASAVTGKTPLAGMLLDESRKGSVIVNVEVEMNSVQDWSLLGYFTGPQVGLEVPIYSKFNNNPDFYEIMSLCAAGIASGSIVMFHLLGVTPEAATLEMATGGKKEKDLRVVTYGSAERKRTYEILNHAKSDKVDLVTLGCPHYSLTRLCTLTRLLEGRKVHPGTALYVFTGRMQKAMADKLGYSEVIQKAGGIILEDSCGQVLELDHSTILASDSAKLVHYIPGTTGVKNTWFGTMEECVEAAITGKWQGGPLQ
jgi:predicted aconitase